MPSRSVLPSSRGGPSGIIYLAAQRDKLDPWKQRVSVAPLNPLKTTCGEFWIPIPWPSLSLDPYYHIFDKKCSRSHPIGCHQQSYNPSLSALSHCILIRIPCLALAIVLFGATAVDVYRYLKPSVPVLCAVSTPHKLPAAFLMIWIIESYMPQVHRYD